MKKIGLLAYGETGYSALKSLLGSFEVKWIVVPENISDAQDSQAVERLAKRNGIKVYRIRSVEGLRQILQNDLPDVVVISSFNLIIPPDVILLTKFINVHHGDLPRFRGRANINWAIINGRKAIGLTIHDVESDLDSGNIYASYKVKITRKDSVKTVYEKFNKILVENLADVVSKVINGYKGVPQKGKATYCCTRLPEDGYIHWEDSTENITNLIRALTTPFPGAFTFLDNKKLYIWDYALPENPRVFEGRIPGRIIGVYPGTGVEVLTGDGSIVIKNVTIEGKNKNASYVIKSVKKTLGINMVKIYEKMLEIEK